MNTNERSTNQKETNDTKAKSPINIKLLIGIALIVIPILIYVLSVIPLLPSGGNDWAGFWGGYLGAIIGAVVTLWGIKITLNETRAQFYLDKSIEHAPFIRFSIKSVDKNSNYINCWDNNYPVQKTYRSSTMNDTFFLELENIGLGPAINLNIKSIIFFAENGDKHTEEFDDNPLKEKSINVAESLFIHINQEIVIDDGEIKYLKDQLELLEEIDISDNEYFDQSQHEKNIKEIKEKLQKASENYEVHKKSEFLVCIMYEDLLKNKYEHILIIESKFDKTGINDTGDYKTNIIKNEKTTTMYIQNKNSLVKNFL